jgi:DNA-binding response OmpR family regulator
VETSKQKILCIEDSDILVSFLRSVLSKEKGFEVDFGHNLKEAYEALRENEGQYKAILLDLGLPDGHGLDVIDAIQSRTKAPLIIYSGHEELKISCLEKGVQAFLLKPTRAADIAKTIVEVVGVNTDQISVPVMKEEIEKKSLGEELTIPLSNHLAAIAINLGCISFVLGCILDMYSQLKIKGMWVPMDWEITCWTALLGMKGTSEIRKKF